LLNAQSCSGNAESLLSLTQPHDYVQKRVSSYDRGGGNADARPIPPGATLDLLDVSGPGVITHIWITIASPEDFHLKKLVLRMSGTVNPLPASKPRSAILRSRPRPIFLYQSIPLAVSPDKALTPFPMPFQKHAHMSVTNEGRDKVDAFYFNIDYRACRQAPRCGHAYFHAQYRQQSPAKGWTSDWASNGDAKVNDKKNLDGKDNYTWLEAAGRGHFVASPCLFCKIRMAVGEGDDMFFVDGESLPSINGTGSEDYFLGAWISAHIHSRTARWARRSKAKNTPAAEAPSTVSISTRHSIHKISPRHHRARPRQCPLRQFFSVAYWYQSEPHAAPPALPPVEARIPASTKSAAPATPCATLGWDNRTSRHRS